MLTEYRYIQYLTIDHSRAKGIASSDVKVLGVATKQLDRFSEEIRECLVDYWLDIADGMIVDIRNNKRIVSCWNITFIHDTQRKIDGSILNRNDRNHRDLVGWTYRRDSEKCSR